MAFAWEIRNWPTVAAFREHLALRDRAACSWVQGVTIHHTAVPTVAQWHGRASMVGMGNFYRDTKQWPSGPHIYVAPDGIWQGTPLSIAGVHAIGANESRWGVEIVGDYTRAAWAEPIRSLAFGALGALLDFRGLHVSPLTVDGHRNYNKPACPGNAIDLNLVRAELAGMATPTPAIPAGVQATADSAILGDAGATADQCVRFILSRPHGEYNAGDVQLIVKSYFAICASVGVDPLLAIAQMIHETGNLSSYWSQRERRNPAGIGVTGVAGQGVWFKTWADDAIPAHVGRLLAYAVAPRTATPVQAALITRALRYRTLPASYRGVAPTLRGLGGRWAVPGTTYGAMIATTANAIRSR